MEYKIFHGDDEIGVVDSDEEIRLSAKNPENEPITNHFLAFLDNSLPEGERYKILFRKSKSPSLSDNVAMLDELPGKFSFGTPERRRIVSFPVLDNELVELKSNIPSDMFFVGSRERVVGKPSFSGYQDKFVAKVVFEDGEIIVSPIDASKEIGNVIVKPSSSLPFVAENEFICMRLAHKVGIDVPRTFLIRHPDTTSSKFHLCVERFDLDYAQSQKKDVAEFSTLLDLPSEQKYSVKTESFFEFAEKLFDKNELQKLATAYMYGAIIGNGDMHIKNFSVFTEGSKFRLTPIYDMLNTKVHGFDDMLALPMKTPRPNNPTMKMFIDFMESYMSIESIKELNDAVKKYLPETLSLVSDSKEFCKKLEDSILKNVKNIEETLDLRQKIKNTEYPVEEIIPVKKLNFAQRLRDAEKKDSRGR